MAKANDANRYRLEAEYARGKMRLAIGDERAAWRQIAEAYDRLEALASSGAKTEAMRTPPRPSTREA